MLSFRARFSLKWTWFLVVPLLLFSFLVPDDEPWLPLPKGSDYASAWKEIDSLAEKGLTRSVLEKVDKIYADAKKAENTPQVVKALIYRLNFGMWIDEDGEVNTILALQEEAEQAAFPLKQVTHSMAAERLWEYYQQNRYRFLNRSETVQFNPKDLNTWDLRRIVSASIYHYEQSLQSVDSLKRVPVRYLDAVLDKSPDSLRNAARALRPTLYDFLAHRALDFYSGSEPGLTRPADHFEVSDPEAFAPADAFIRHSFATTDSLSLHARALALLQDLLAFHQNDEDPAPGVMVDLQRLQFSHKRTTHPAKDSIYLVALETLEKSQGEHPVSAEVAYERAEVLFNLPHHGRGINNTNRWDRKKALEICDAMIERFPDSRGARQCRNLRQEILQPTVALAVESVNIPDKPFRALLTSSNVDTLFWRIVPLKADEPNFRFEHRDNQEQLNQYLKRPVVKEGWLLPGNDGTYQDRSVEIPLPALPVGRYAVLSSNGRSFTWQRHAVRSTAFWVSNLSYLQRGLGDRYQAYVLHRHTGKPLANVQVTAYTREYQRKSREYHLKKVGTFTTNKRGMVEIPDSEEARELYVELQHGKDRLFTGDGYYAYYYRESKPEVVSNAHFFTDRAIYRPGQTVFFKAILVQSEGDQHQLATNQQLTVTLYDVNYQEQSKLELISNEFGTVQGSFVLPRGGLNGRMTLKSEIGRHTIRVEEYKRPTFEVTFDTLAGTYRLGDAVTATGLAKAYSGANLDGAQVDFRVSRSVRYPRWWGYYSRSGFDVGASVEIVNGTTQTAADGSFAITFQAQPDRHVDPFSGATFTYEITADVTDINGETHSTTETVQVGYRALELAVPVPWEVERNAPVELTVKATNLAGKALATQGRVTVHRLKAPERVLRDRLWSTPDTFYLSDAAFAEQFPEDPIQEENDFRQWPKGAKVAALEFNTAEQTKLALPDLSNWEPGRYVLEATAMDAYGDTVKDMQHFIVYDRKQKAMPFAAPFWVHVPKKRLEPGETAEVLMGSAYKDATVLYEVELRGKIVHREWQKLSNSLTRFSLPITETHRGNVGIYVIIVHSGRVYKRSQRLFVPYTNKQLKLAFATFRNKLQPGEQETWQVKINGPKGEQVAAEMVAALYDQSLDVFESNDWQLDIYEDRQLRRRWTIGQSFDVAEQQTLSRPRLERLRVPGWHHDRLLWFIGESNGVLSGFVNRGARSGVAYAFAAPAAAADASNDVQFMAEEAEVEEVEGSVAKKLEVGVENFSGPGGEDDEETTSTVVPRTNFNETAFFFPQLSTNAEGAVTLNFTIPEALTRWRFLGLAHTKDLQIGQLGGETVTQKELMVVPNMPRFFREKDRMTLVSKITNLSEATLSGNSTMQFFDATTMAPIDAQMHTTSDHSRAFSVPAGQSTTVAWEVAVPEGVQAITYRVIAQAGDFSDGEEMALPVLSNRMLVTEALPLPVTGKGTHTFTLKKLQNSGSSATLKHHRLTLEFTENPAWYAVQALPYLMEYPHDCSEQIFSRYYANSLGSHIANAHPRVKQVFDTWKNYQPDALLSNLDKNPELKAIIQEETPWVMDAKDEREQKQRIALLFDLNHMGNEQNRAVQQLKKAQASNGAWPWFPGMRENRYITQHIVTGLGHLNHLGVTHVSGNRLMQRMVQRALAYLDREIKADFDRLKRQKADLSKNHLSRTAIQYLYARSFFPNQAVLGQSREAEKYYREQAGKYWLQQPIYLQGMIALALHRNGNTTIPPQIMASLKENAIVSKELGMYWKGMQGGYYWHQAPIETQALLIEAFTEVAEDAASVAAMKLWLLQQKRTQNWKTTKATVEACYALLLQGDDWLSRQSTVQLKVGNQPVTPEAKEAGTGYTKTAWAGAEVAPEMATVTVDKAEEGAAWGALYWQYFEDLDKITPHDTPLKLEQQLFKEVPSNTGPVITPIIDATALKPGDKITVRIELRSDRDLEYVHLKDMHASGLDHVRTTSGYRYQDGLGYYESAKDASVNFFFDRLPRGTYVFEYPLKVTHAGDFSNGISQIQCLYAPEFTAHSAGVRVGVE